tara:strand:- start:308 stop:952 length:645 start_codon:yes stop_codon:yes gene_type:complete
MKNILLLNSSLIIKKPVFNKDDIKIEYGKSRLKSYHDGFLKINENNLFNKFDKTILIDNTISKINQIPSEILNLLPKNIEFLLHKNNELGRRNKGAGMLSSLSKNKKKFVDSELIFYFEPRLLLQTSQFIERFLMEKVNYFSMESEKRVKTGYFGSTSKDLLEFIDSHSPLKIADNNLHIELLMYDFYNSKKTNFLNTSISLWKNYLSEIYEEY